MALGASWTGPEKRWRSARTSAACREASWTAALSWTAARALWTEAASGAAGRGRPSSTGRGSPSASWRRNQEGSSACGGSVASTASHQWGWGQAEARSAGFRRRWCWKRGPRWARIASGEV
ncbi:hypothetical protein [Actinocorallia libanotica]|uniref:hypothetical protein n=1 Tax=Actinocorallia libanotica TaxID=46162 RepID=UPI0031CFFF69